MAYINFKNHFASIQCSWNIFVYFLAHAIK